MGRFRFSTLNWFASNQLIAAWSRFILTGDKQSHHGRITAVI
jgi:hypothetical protein